MKNIYILIISFFIAFNLQAQPFSLDTTFYINYNFNFSGGGGIVNGLNYEPDGKIMIYGSFWDGSSNISDVFRTYEDGSFDNTWQFIGTGASFSFGNIMRLNNNYINWVSNLLIKFNYLGQETDTSWVHNIDRGNICHDFFKPYIFSDGSMLVGTDSICLSVSDKKRWFMRFLPDGNVDTNFIHSTNGLAFGIVKYSSDKLLVYGGGQRGFTKYDNIPAIRLCRIDTLGNLDTTFKSIFTDGMPFPSYIQNDGKIIICQAFRIENNPNVQGLVRLNVDGSLDSTFNNFNSVIYSNNGDVAATVCPTTDGGYLIGGQFSQYQSYTRHNIVKTDANGFIDTTYFNGLGIDSVFSHNGGTPVVGSIVKGINDNYYVMGSFTHYNGVKVNPIIRIHGLSVGINEVEKENVKIYPNPANNSITFNTGLYHDFKLTIFNAIGQTVLQKQLATYNTTLNIQSFQQGMYYYTLINDKGKVISGKFVKE